MSTDVMQHGTALPQYFTTGQVARMLRVAPRTISKWFDSGRLTGARLPGCNHDRRIAVASLVAFMREHGWTHEALFSPHCPGVLAVTTDLTRFGLQDATQAASWFEAGRLLAGAHWRAVILDACMGRSSLVAALPAIAATVPRPAICVVTCEDEIGGADLIGLGADTVIPWPWRPLEVLAWIQASTRDHETLEDTTRE